MAQLDRLLTHVIQKGAKRLRLEPNVQPVLELADGKIQPLLPNAMPAMMVEVLTSEVVPKSMPDWRQKSSLDFDYVADDRVFQIQVRRVSGGVVLIAEPPAAAAPRPAAPAAAAPPAPARPAPPPLRPPVQAPPPVVAPPMGSAPQAAAPAPRRAPDPSLELRIELDGAEFMETGEPAPPPKPKAKILPPASSLKGLAPKLFMTLLERSGSDLHCSSGELPILRVHGELEEAPEFGVLEASTLMPLMQELAPKEVWAHFLERHDADFAYPFEAGDCRFRVNYFMDRRGPGLVCRVIPSEIPDPDKLGLPDPIRKLSQLPKGLVLVTGPTGSGKSTTLAAIIDIANRNRKDHILTIEDPIEFVHPRKKCLVNQREIGTHTDSFKSGLRAALREDPDIVLVGEMRDLETISIALETALTGHLVFGTLHTNSAVGTIDRVVDQFPADRQQQVRVMLADCLKAVVSQILLKKIGGGRVAALESLFVGPAISNLIREAKTFQIPSAMQTGRSFGQRLMNDALIELILAKQVEPIEAYMKCPDKDTFIQACKRNSIAFDLRMGELQA